MMPIFKELLEDDQLEDANGGSDEAIGGIAGRNDRSRGNDCDCDSSGGGDAGGGITSTSPGGIGGGAF